MKETHNDGFPATKLPELDGTLVPMEGGATALAPPPGESAGRYELLGEIALAHRLGRLEVGAVSVAVAVSCPHRAEAFEACRHAIDRLKELVPIWKREHGPAGVGEWVHP